VSTEGLVTTSRTDGVTEIVLDDGKANVMTLAMLNAIDEALDEAEKAESVVLLCGRDGLFSGGYDVAMFTRSEEEVLRTLRAGGNLVHRIHGFPYPVVVASTGHAIAQGAFTLLAADVRIGCDQGAKMGLNEVVIGLTIPHYGIEVARQRMAPAWFNQATTTGALYGPEDSLAAGFVDRLVPAAEVVAESRSVAQGLTAIDMTAHAGTKQRVRRSALDAIRTMHDDEFPPLD
jgi:enoyl-CoA hydratase